MQPFISNLAFALMGMGTTRYGRTTPSYKHGYSFRPQSAESKQFHLGRAEIKRKRKAAINVQRVLRGEMQPYLRHSDDGALIVSQETFDLFSKADLNAMTVSDLIAHGKRIGVHVTTKMTKAKLIETISAIN